MRLGKFSKAPGDRKRYTIDYSEWLDLAETITSVQHVTDGTAGGIYVDGILASPDGKSVVMFVSGGLEGNSYDLGLRIETSGDQVKDDFITFVVRDVPDLFVVAP